uniref:Transposase n=1 Tax=Globodera rostochiensis TaxID=31243 RepID=A0A914IEX4_GLORO
MKNINEKIEKKLGVSLRTINLWKNQLGVSKTQKKHTDAEKVELLKKFYKIKKENPQLRKFEIANMLNIDKRTLGLWEMKSKGLTGINKNYTEVEKQEIIAEFDKLKNEFKARYKGMPYENINEKIVQKLGVSLRTINLWKKQLGVSKPQKKHTDAEKVELLKKCCKIKKENPQLRKYEIAKMLNIDKTTLSLWERESKGIKPGIRKSEVEKQEIIAEWKKQFGASKNRKKHTEAKKAEFMKQFYKIEEKNPKMNKEEIAQRLNIPMTTINRWKRQFKVDDGGLIDNQRHGGSERSTSSANSLNDIPWKWNVFGKKRNERIGKIPHKCYTFIP